MKASAVHALYNPETAARYNEAWHGGVWESDTGHLLDALRRRVTPETRWLDVGCGTGYFLSQFPGVARAGLDLTPAMLERARGASPDALFFREDDLRHRISEWEDRWTLVTCTGGPWSYVDSVADFEHVVANLARWTAPDGTCLLAVYDVADITGVSLPYGADARPGFRGQVYVEAVVVSLVGHDEEEGHNHDSMIWPALEHWVELFGRHFRRVEVEYLPHEPAFMPTRRRLVVASEKRRPGDLDRPMARNARDTSLTPMPGGPGPSAGSHESQPADQPVPIRDLSVGYLISQIRPWRRSFWRSVSRRSEHLRSSS